MTLRLIAGIALAAVLAIAVINCAVTGPGGKKSLIFIGTDTEISIGAGMDSTVRKDNPILRDTVWQNYLNGIGQKIASSCDRRDIEYHFAVIDSDIVNAFAAPGGYIFVYTGLLKTMDNEGELAAVLAHEISHIVARHSIKQLQAAMGVSLVEQLVFGKDANALQSAINIGLGLAFAGYSRADENEADNYGIQYMVRAGYNPEAAITMFEKLAAMSSETTNIFEKLSASHPDTQERIQKSKALIDSMKPLPQGLQTYPQKYKIMKSRLRI